MLDTRNETFHLHVGFAGGCKFRSNKASAAQASTGKLKTIMFVIDHPAFDGKANT